MSQFTHEDPFYRWAMWNENFTPSVHAFIYAYANIFAYSNVRSAYLSGKLKFGPKSVTIVDDPEWFAKKVPKKWHREHSSRVPTFWGFVEYFCREILMNSVYFLKKGGAETSGGFGLYLHKDSDNKAISEAILGLVEPLTPTDLLHMESLNFKSFIKIDKVNTCMLYGPLCLLNNDNFSTLEFVDRDYLSGKVMHKLIPMEGIPEHMDTPVCTVHRFRVVRVHAIHEFVLVKGKQIKVKYNDERFQDFSHDSSSGDEGGCVFVGSCGSGSSGGGTSSSTSSSTSPATSTTTSQCGGAVKQENSSSRSAAATTSGARKRKATFSEDTPAHSRSFDQPVVIQPRSSRDTVLDHLTGRNVFGSVRLENAYRRSCPTMPPPVRRYQPVQLPGNRKNSEEYLEEVKREEHHTPESQLLMRRPTPLKAEDPRTSLRHQNTPRRHISAAKQVSLADAWTGAATTSYPAAAAVSVVHDTYADSQQIQTPPSSCTAATTSTVSSNANNASHDVGRALAQFPMATLSHMHSRAAVLRDLPGAIETGVVRMRHGRIASLNDDEATTSGSSVGDAADSSPDDDSTYNPDDEEETQLK